MEVEFIAGFSPIVPDAEIARRFYGDELGVRFEGSVGNYRFTEVLDGAHHFGLWPLSEAAAACFGTPEWPPDVPVPQATLEFEVRDVAAAAEELEANGHRLLHAARREPWGQVVARLLGPEGLLVGVCFTPQFHEAARPHEADETGADA